MTAPLEAAGAAVDVAPPAQLQITTDREKLTRITQHLLRNAVQHGRDRLLIELGESKGGALLKVTNGVPDGKRIDAERLFDRFYTEDRSRSGPTSALGRSLVRVLAQQRGGEVTARQVAAGAPVTFSVWLPHVAGA